MLKIYLIKWNHSASYVGISTAFEDIRLLLDQQSEAQIPLVNYATVEMHQTHRMLRQFRFQQPISVAPEVLDDEHKIDLRQSNTNWLIFWLEYIEMWKNRYDHIPTRESIIVPELRAR
ncbi:hypothetical protein Gotri_016590 [Gossypium trilobum]|uniref:Uncharacterized protein n=1 Tax=Gossypium trilobum TaxID=34281 RepID=A0A7J9E457_9ROSI|nr:hypothetical protein [Gossypium trilobum]